MDFLTALQILLRRWYVVVVGLLLTVAAVVGVVMNMSANYRTVGSLVFLAPTSGVDGQTRPTTTFNPLTQFAGYLATTAELVQQVVSGESYATELEPRGATGTFTVVSDGPILTVTAEGRSEEESTRTAKVVMDAIRSELDRRQVQYGAPTKDLIRVDTLVPPDTAAFEVGSQMRAGGALAILGLASTVVVAIRIDRFRLRREAGSAPAAAGSAPPPAPPSVPPPVPAPPEADHVQEAAPVGGAAPDRRAIGAPSESGGMPVDEELFSSLLAPASSQPPETGALTGLDNAVPTGGMRRRTTPSTDVRDVRDSAPANGKAVGDSGRGREAPSPPVASHGTVDEVPDAVAEG